jgi:hypothetical protein
VGFWWSCTAHSKARSEVKKVFLRRVVGMKQRLLVYPRLVCIGRPRGLFDQTSDHSILAGVRTASLGGTLLSQTAQPGITAATTALAVEHNSLRRIRDTAAALAAFSRDPQLYLAGFDR